MFKDRINEGIEHHIKAALKEDTSTIEVNYNADNNKVDSLEQKYSVTISRSGRDKIRVTGDSAKVWNLAKDFHKGSKPAAEAHPNLAKKVNGTDNPDKLDDKDKDDQAVAKKKVSDMQKTDKDKFFDDDDFRGYNNHVLTLKNRAHRFEVEQAFKKAGYDVYGSDLSVSGDKIKFNDYSKKIGRDEKQLKKVVMDVLGIDIDKV